MRTVQMSPMLDMKYGTPATGRMVGSGTPFPVIPHIPVPTTIADKIMAVWLMGYWGARMGSLNNLEEVLATNYIDAKSKASLHNEYKYIRAVVKAASIVGGERKIVTNDRSDDPETVDARNRWTGLKLRRYEQETK